MENADKRQSPLRTLALDPGTREAGYAVLEGTELLFFGVHTFKHRKSARSLLKEGQGFVSGLVDAFDPQIFVIEKTFYAKSKRSSLLHVFADEIARFARGKRLRVLAYAPSTVKKAIAGNGAATKRQVAETLVRHWYPYLEKYLRTDLRTQERYWENMFDAVALGLTGHEEVVRERVRRVLKLKAPK